MEKIAFILMVAFLVAAAYAADKGDDAEDEMDDMFGMDAMEGKDGKGKDGKKAMLDLEKMNEMSHRPLAGLTGMLEMKVMIKMSQYLFGDLLKMNGGKKDMDMEGDMKEMMAKKMQEMMMAKKGKADKESLEELWEYAEMFGLQRMLGLDAFYKSTGEMKAKGGSKEKDSEEMDDEYDFDDKDVEWDDFEEGLVEKSGFKMDKFKELIMKLIMQMMGELKEIMFMSGKDDIMEGMIGEGMSDGDKIEDYKKMMGGMKNNKTVMEMAKKMMKEKKVMEALGLVYMVNVIEKVKPYTWCIPEAREDPMKRKWCVMIMEEVRVMLAKTQPAIPTTGGMVSGYLDVRYSVAKPLDMDVCCREFFYPPSKTVIDPIHWREGIFLHRFQEEKPTVTLQGHKPGKKYTFIMLDLSVNTNNAGTKERPVVHWMFYNAVGPSMTNGQEGIPYLKPLSPHLFLFMAFEQEGDISVGEYGVRCPNNRDNERRCLFDITRLIRDKNLKLVAFNFMHARKDATYQKNMMDSSSVSSDEACKMLYPDYKPNSCPNSFDYKMTGVCHPDNRMNRAGLQACLDATKRGIMKYKDHPFIPATPTLDMYIDITLTTTKSAQVYDTCCGDYHAAPARVTLDPVNGYPIPLSAARGSMEWRIKSLDEPEGISVKSNVYYTLMVFDRVEWTVNGEPRSSKDRPWLHLLQVNIESNSATSGETIKEWHKPGGPDIYEFFLYRQTNRIDTGPLTGAQFENTYSSSCSYLPGRCNFNVKKFVDDLGLTLKAVNFYHGLFDRYMAYRYIHVSKMKAEDVCQYLDKDIKFEEGKPMCIGYSSCNIKKQHKDIRQYVACHSQLESTLIDMHLPFVPSELELPNPVSVIFKAEPWHAKGICCHDFYYPKRLQVIDPYVDAMGIDTYITNEEPHIYYKSTPGKKYSLALFNPFTALGEDWGSISHVLMHMLKVNLNGMGVGETLLSYAGSILEVEKLHLVVLFEQERNIQVDTSRYASECPNNAMAAFGNKRCKFDMPSFTADHNLKVVGVSWFTTRRDAHWAKAAMYLYQKSPVEVCPLLWHKTPIIKGKVQCPQNEILPLMAFDRTACMYEKRANPAGMYKCMVYMNKYARQLNTPLLPMGQDLRVYLDIGYKRDTVQEYTDLCCQDFRYGKSEIWIDPLKHPEGHMLYQTLDVTPFYATAQGAKQGKLHTFMMLDLEVNTPGVGTDKRPVVHWFYTNVMPPTLTNGDQITEYLQPMSPHLFVFLLFEQEARIESVNKVDYGIECPGGNFLGTRCFFNMHQFWMDNKLKLVGANWFRPRPDATFVKTLETYFNMQRGPACQVVYPDIKVDGQQQPICDSRPLWSPVESPCLPSKRVTTDGMIKCLDSMNKVLQDWDTPFISKTVQFEMFLDIRLNTRSVRNYEVCCANYKTPSMYLALDPVMPFEISIASARDREPEVTIRSRDSPEGINNNDYYTLVMIDRTQFESNGVMSTPDRSWLHWVKVNIRGNRFSTSGTVAREYFLPAASNTHEFYLFRQENGVINPNMDDYTNLTCAVLPGRCMFDMGRFMRDSRLRIKSFNILKGRYDSYRAFNEIYGPRKQPEDKVCKKLYPMMKTEEGKPQCYSGFSPCASDKSEKECKTIVEEALSEMVIVPTDVYLTKHLKVKFESEPYEVKDLCCKDFSYAKKSYQVDPLKAWYGVDLYLMRKEPEIEIEYEDGKKYTLLMIDAFSKTEGLGNYSHPVLHWAKSDISKDFEHGTVLVPYLPPGIDHFFVFLLYEQSGSDNLNANMNGLLHECSVLSSRHCYFDINQFVDQNKLTLVGANFLMGKKDVFYLKHILIDFARIPESMACLTLFPDTPFIGSKPFCKPLIMNKEKEKKEKKMPAMSEMLEMMEPIDYTACLKDKLEEDEDLETCMEQMSKSMKMTMEPLLPYDHKLSTYISVEYEVKDPLQFKLCCKTHMMPPSKFTVDPLTAKYGFYLGMTRGEDPPKVTLKGGEEGKLYTFIVAFTSVDKPGLGTKKRPIILWLSVNGMSPSVASGNQVISYDRPRTPGMFLFMVYKQKKQISVKPMMYGQDCNMAGVQGARCNFDVNSLVYDFDLHLVGANWMRLVVDGTFAWNLKELERLSEADACKIVYPDLEVEDGELECPERELWAAESPCSPENRESPEGLQACLTKMSQDSQTTSSYPVAGQYISSMEFDTYLDVEISSDGYQAYMTCCFSYAGGSANLALDPVKVTSLPVAMTQGKYEFKIQTVAEPDGVKDSTQLYTLMMLDGTDWVEGNENRASAARPWIHYLVINIPGGDIEKGKELKSMFKPLTGNKHEFFLYKQNAKINDELNVDGYTLKCSAIPGRCSFNLGKFVTDQNLKLKSVNRLQGEFDGYAVFKRGVLMNRGLEDQCKHILPNIEFEDDKPKCMMKDLKKISPCAESKKDDKLSTHICKSITQAGLADGNFPYVDFDVMLKSPVKVTFKSEAMTMKKFCCEHYKYEKEEVVLEPVAFVEGLSNYLTKEAPEIEFNTEEDGLYTLVMINVVSGWYGMGNHSHPSIKWLQVNKKGGSDEGDVILDYKAPQTMSTYLIMVYKQPSRINAAIGWFVQKCAGYDTYRCFFNQKMFVDHHKLKLIGVNSFSSKMDAYMGRNIVDTMDIPEGKMCGYVNPEVKVNDKYEPQCPSNTKTSGATVITSHLLYVLLLLAVKHFLA